MLLLSMVERSGRCVVCVWVVGTRGIPDVPHAANEVTSQKCTEGSGVGFIKEPPVLFEAGIAKDFERHGVPFSKSAKLGVLFDLTKEKNLDWKAELISDERLLLHMPNTALPDGSKEGFVQILELAEEELGCSEVVVEFGKNRQDRALLIRTFMYFGFAILAPDISQSIVGPDRIAMLYKI